MGKPNVIVQDAKPSHQRGTRRRAHAGGSIGPCEQQTVARQLIDVGGLEVLIALRPKQAGALVVGHVEKHVRPFLGRDANREQGCQSGSCIDRAGGRCSPQNMGLLRKTSILMNLYQSSQQANRREF